MIKFKLEAGVAFPINKMRWAPNFLLLLYRICCILSDTGKDEEELSRKAVLTKRVRNKQEFYAVRAKKTNIRV